MSDTYQRGDREGDHSAEVERLEQLAKLPLWALYSLLAVILAGMVGTAVVLVSSVATRFHLSGMQTAALGGGVAVLLIVGLVVAVIGSRRWR